MTHVVIVKDAVIGSPHGILQGSLTTVNPIIFKSFKVSYF